MIVIEMDAMQMQALLQQQSQFMTDLLTQQATAHAASMATMATMVTTLQEDVKAAVENRAPN